MVSPFSRIKVFSGVFLRYRYFTLSDPLYTLEVESRLSPPLFASLFLLPFPSTFRFSVSCHFPRIGFTCNVLLLRRIGFTERLAVHTSWTWDSPAPPPGWLTSALREWSFQHLSSSSHLGLFFRDFATFVSFIPIVWATTKISFFRLLLFFFS